MRNNILYILLFLFTIGGKGQDFISKQEAIEDIDYFVGTAEDTHINLYERISKKDFLRLAEDLKNNLPEKVSVNDFSKEMRALANRIGDGHTNVSFSKDLSKKYFEAKCSFPFKVKIKDSQITLTSSLNSTLQKGDIIHSINGINSEDLVKLRKYPMTDIDEFKDKILADFFSYFVFVEYGFENTVKMEVERNGKIIIEDINLLAVEKKKNKNEKPYSFHLLNDTVGVLEITSFSNSLINKGEYKKFLEKTFAEIKKNGVKSLIIDLQKNGGGNSRFGYMLFPFLNAKVYYPSKLTQIKTSKLEKKYFRKKFIKWYLYPLYPFAYFNGYTRILFFKKNGTITNIELAEESVKAAQDAFAGKVYVLTSGSTYSASATFLAAFKYAKRGKIIGETIGQPYTGFIDKVPFKLPNSRLNAGVSFKRYEYVGAMEKNKHQGIEPDYFLDREDFDSEEVYIGELLKVMR